MLPAGSPAAERITRGEPMKSTEDQAAIEAANQARDERTNAANKAADDAARIANNAKDKATDIANKEADRMARAAGNAQDDRSRHTK
jgi:hypothetical protein